jgi:CTP synthase (UTP-ammonia lyase)
MTQTKAAKPPAKKMVRALVRKYLTNRTPSGYSLVVPDDGVMFVSDGVEHEHHRWYVQVQPDPEYIADTRRQEYLRTLAEVEDEIHKKHKLTVSLTSMLPML